MRKLVYSTSLSLVGYIDPAAGDPSWVVPDEELHRHFNEVEREAGLIDEYRLYYVPIFLGSGKAAFSQIQNSVRLKPVETRTFSSGTVLLRCAPVSP